MPNSRPQAYNRAHGKQEVPLGMLVRPWATQHLGDLKDYRPQDWPPGSSEYIKSKATNKC